MEYLAGLGTRILHIAVLVELQDGRLLAVEDRPVAQRAVVFQPFQAQFLRHVFLGADDDRGLAVLVAFQHGEHDVEVAQLAIAVFRVHGSQIQRDFLFLVALGIPMLAHESVEGIFQQTEITREVAVGEIRHGVGVYYLAVVVVPGKVLLFHVVCPDAHLACLDDERQSAVQLPVGSCHLAVLQPVANAVDERHNQQQRGYSRQYPYPVRCRAPLVVRVEPLVLQFGDFAGHVELRVGPL